METLFWLSFIFVAYVYLGYPLLLAIASRIAGSSLKKAYAEPEVTIVIAVYNERERLEAKLENCLTLDYPKRKLQVLVSLDGPTDGSEFLVWKYAAMGVEMVHCNEHCGKASALNRAVRRATGEIVVFADVRQMFDRAAVRELVANFADKNVGAVSGELVLVDSTETLTRPFGRPSPRGRGTIGENHPCPPGRGWPEGPGEGRNCDEESITDIGLYWRYEKAIRLMESRIHSMAGATGAIYAIRRELYSDIPEDTLLDDVLIPMRIVISGKRAVFEPAAKAYDVVSCCPLAEFGRKVRTLTGNYQLLAQLPQLVVPWRNPIFFQFISHKAGRLFVPYALIALFTTNLFLLHGIYAVFFSLQSAWYLLAAAGYVFSSHEVMESIPVSGESRRAA